MFLKKTETLNIKEMQAFVTLFNFLDDGSRRRFPAAYNVSRSNAVKCSNDWKHYSTYFEFMPYQRLFALQNMNFVQFDERKIEKRFGVHVRILACGEGDVYEQTEKNNIFSNWSHVILRLTAVKLFESQPRSAGCFDELIQLAVIEGGAYGARQKVILDVRLDTLSRTGLEVHFMEVAIKV